MRGILVLAGLAPVGDRPAYCDSCGVARPAPDHQPDGQVCLTLQAERDARADERRQSW